MKKIIISFVAFFSFVGAKADIIPIPEDLPTIEALISLHKSMKKAEDKAMANVATSYGTQTLVTKHTNLFNDSRETLNSKLNNAYSYVLMGAALSSTSMSLYKLIVEYGKFTKLAINGATQKPVVAWYYANACYACAKEYKNIQTIYASIFVSDFNIIKASMDERLELIYSLKTSIDNMLRIIDDAYLWCSVVVIGGFQYDYIWEILNSEVTNKIAKGVIAKWNKA